MGGFFKKAVIARKESATVQHEVYKAEAKASFEENRGCNTFAKASHVSVNTFRALFQKYILFPLFPFSRILSIPCSLFFQIF